MTTDGNLSVLTPKHQREAKFLTRTDTNDGALVVGIVADDEYGLRDLPQLSGTAIDVGAHIGTVAVTLAIDHPDLRVIAVEPVPENVEVLRANIAENGLNDRITVWPAAAAGPRARSVSLTWNYRSAAQEPPAYVKDSRYIAGIYDAADSDSDTFKVTAVDLAGLMAGLDTVALLKVDCEGCEWSFLRSKRTADVEIIVGEFHNGHGIAGLRKLLPTHDVEQTDGGPDVGIFRAVRR